MKGDKLKNRIPEWTDAGEQEREIGMEDTLKEIWDTVGQSEDFIHNLLHDGGNQHGIVGTYIRGRNMSTHDAWYFAETEYKFNKG